MPITINGTGTITGISAGGLPDGVVTQPELASGVAGTGPAFSAYNTVNQNLSEATWTKIVLGTESFDTANCFDTSNGRFTPNVAGYYQFIGGARCYGTSAINYTFIAISKNGGLPTQAALPMYLSNYAVGQVSTVLYMNGSTDYVELYVLMSTTSTTRIVEATAEQTNLSGALVRAA